MAYDANNVFAQILEGKMPAHKVFENDHTLAFLDIMPVSVGHTLIVPKAEAENIFELENEPVPRCLKPQKKLLMESRLHLTQLD